MLAWTVLLLLTPGALLLWTTSSRLARRRRSALVSTPAQRTSQPEWNQAKRRASADVLTILAVEGRGIALRVRRRRIALGSARPAAALTAPAHRVRVAPEAIAMAQETTAQH